MSCCCSSKGFNRSAFWADDGVVKDRPLRIWFKVAIDEGVGAFVPAFSGVGDDICVSFCWGVNGEVFICTLIVETNTDTKHGRLHEETKWLSWVVLGH